MKLHIVDASGQSSPFYFTFISVGTEGSHSVTGDLGVNAIAVVIMAAAAAEIKAKSAQDGMALSHCQHPS